MYSFYEWLGPLVFHVLSPWVLRAETIAVQAALSPIGGFARDGLVISPGRGYELADRAYLDHPGNGSTHVYRGQVRQTFSHLARVPARNPLTPYRLDCFVRFYPPSDCAIDNEAYIEWAEMILAMGTASPGSGQGS